MRRFDWRWLAVSSVLVASMAAETRPQYGGTLHVALREALQSLDPADGTQADSFARRSVAPLMFDTLVTSDENGRLQPSLATSWQVAPAKQRWQFRLRRGVKFHDGTPLTAEIAAASLRNANPSWTVTVEAESVVIEQDSADPDLPAELALARNAIVRRNADGTTSGTGPFHIVDWQAGKKLTLAAEEACWHGRPYLDGIEIEMGRNYHDQMMSLDLGKADLAEVPAEQVHRAALEGRGLVSSFPVELLALVFARDASAPEEKLLREALAFSVERGSIRSVLLQGMGRPAGGVLPDWISGYGFVFPTDADLTRARHAREQVHTIPAWTLGYDGTDGLARLLAERIALNAKDAGLSVQPTSAAVTDVRLVRISLASADAWIALTQMGALVGFSVARKNDGAAEDLYNAEQSLLTTQRIIPLFHLPASYAAAANLKDWTVRPDGTWNLADAWLGSRRP